MRSIIKAIEEVYRPRHQRSYDDIDRDTMMALRYELQDSFSDENIAKVIDIFLRFRNRKNDFVREAARSSIYTVDGGRPQARAMEMIWDSLDAAM